MALTNHVCTTLTYVIPGTASQLVALINYVLMYHSYLCHTWNSITTSGTDQLCTNVPLLLVPETASQLVALTYYIRMYHSYLYHIRTPGTASQLVTSPFMYLYHMVIRTWNTSQLVASPFMYLYHMHLEQHHS